MRKFFFLFIFFLFPLLSFSSVWTEPGCDPSADGPECADTTAPINTSSSDQIKVGGLSASFFNSNTFQNTTGALSIQAASGSNIVMQSNVVINNTVSITPTTGTALTITPTSSDSAIYVNSSTTSPTINIANSSGTGIYATSSVNSATVGTYKAIYGESTGTGSYAIQGYSSNYYGVYGLSGGSGYYGVVGCYRNSSGNPVNCANLGGRTMAAQFNGSITVSGNVNVSASNVNILNRTTTSSSAGVQKGITLYTPPDPSTPGSGGSPYCIKLDSSGAALTFTSGICP